MWNPLEQVRDFHAISKSTCDKFVSFQNIHTQTVAAVLVIAVLVLVLWNEWSVQIEDWLSHRLIRSRFVNDGAIQQTGGHGNRPDLGQPEHSAFTNSAWN